MQPTVFAPSTRASRDRRGTTFAFVAAALADASAASHALAGAPAAPQDVHTVTAQRRVRALNRIQQHLHSYAAPRR